MKFTVSTVTNPFQERVISGNELPASASKENAS
jgi:hypothetical protein